MSPAKKVEQQIVLPPLKVETMSLTLVGDSGLISHRWSQKAKQEMLDKQMKKAKQAKQAKDPNMDFAQSMYLFGVEDEEQEAVYRRIAEGNYDGVRFGFPAVAFKAAAVSACRFADGVKMTEARGAFHVVGELVEIKTPGPHMREDMVKIAMGTADLRYRGEFREWSAEITLRYNINALSPSQIMNQFNIAGFGVGVGEWRPEKDGSHGNAYHSARLAGVPGPWQAW